MNSTVKERRCMHKRSGELILFLAVMGLTLYTVLRGQNLKQIAQAIGRMSLPYLLLAVSAGLFFVCAEGCMIWYLLRSLNGKSSLRQCIGYSFVGFFYSGITPSATGGQPAQLYYMRRDGNSLADCSVILMTTALLYKLVLVVVGILLLLCFHGMLRGYLKGYYSLYFFGLSLNMVLVALLAAVMAAPARMKHLIRSARILLVKIRLLKESSEKAEKTDRFIDGYQEAVRFLWEHKGRVFMVLLFTFIQRSSLFILTALIYKGFALQGTSWFAVAQLQAAVYIAVDMLPVPGAQGITELMYRSVFAAVFPGEYLMASLYVTRGIGFYFLLLVSLLAVLIRWMRGKGYTLSSKGVRKRPLR